MSTKEFDKLLNLDITDEKEKNLPVVQSPNLPVISNEETPSKEEKDFDEDFEIGRIHLQDAIKTAEEIGEYFLDVAKSSEKAVDAMAVSSLLKTKIQAIEALMNIHKSKKELKQKVPGEATPGGGTVNNTQNNNIVFNGTAMELRKLMMGEKNKGE